MNDSPYKLSPSDFRYLWEDCKHCFYLKVKKGINQPSIGIPGVFMKMNSLLQKDIEGVNLKDINPNLPSGVIETKEGYLKSKPIPPAESSFISGRFDIISKLDDGTFAIIDFKISDPNEEKVKKVRENSFEVWVKEPPARGLANMAIKNALAEYFNVSSAKVRLVSGFSSKNKIFEIS